ncbi:MAG: hypothetical protein AAGB12_02745 [Pseudomonadota bacterium]
MDRNEQEYNKIRNLMLLGVVIFQLCQLTWEYLNGGVVSHHLLMRPDLPAISNGWGLIILPMLVWCASILINKRRLRASQAGIEQSAFQRTVVIGFVAILLLSVLQSFIFYLGYHNIAVYMLLGFMISGLFVPIYRVECILGYVLGATFFSGPVIPFIGVSMFVGVSALSHVVIKPLFLRMKLSGVKKFTT